MDLVIDLTGSGEKTLLVYRALRAAIVDGRLPAGHRLPPSRALAADLGVARGSVATAYERLAAEGFLTSRVGSGTFVAEVPEPRKPRRAAADPLRPRSGWTFGPCPPATRRPRRGTTSAAACRTPPCSRSTPGGGSSRPSCGCGPTAPGRTGHRPATRPCVRRSPGRWVTAARCGRPPRTS